MCVDVDAFDRLSGAKRQHSIRRESPSGHIRDRVIEVRDDAMPETRKLAAILAADVVGYSRLMGEDEAGTARAVSQRREAAVPIVASKGGRVVKTTGDGLLLEFPSVVAAVECAIAIQKLMAERNAETPEAKRILYRIGVNLGDVLVEGEDILGDGVNIAARLEGLCDPGGVFISSGAYEHVRGRVHAHFIDLGEKDLKNIARPVRVYAIKPSARGGRPAPPPPRRTSRSRRASPSWSYPSPTSAAILSRSISSTAGPTA
jgi:class 3 adenylate cyclase